MFAPSEPAWTPSRDRADAATEYVRSIAPFNDDIEAVFFERIEFHSGMGNWSGVTCPACGNDLETWFFEEATRAFDATRFETLDASTPCCETNTSLNDLNFGWPAAFSRFALVARNPGLIPTPEQEARIEALLGHPVRTIWEHI